jgi:hypothetical protein
MFRFPYRPAWVEHHPDAPPNLWSQLLRLVSGSSPRAERPFIDRVPRPVVSVRVHGPVSTRWIKSAVLDTGSQDTLFPMLLAEPLGVLLGGERGKITWRGQRYWVEFHGVDLELEQGGAHWRWRARVGFTAAPLGFVLLGQRGFLEFFDAKFRGADHVVELEPNRLYPGIVEPRPSGS